MGGAVQGLMKLAVDHHKLVRAILVVRLRRRDLEELLYLRLGRVLRRQRSCGAFKDLAYRVELDQTRRIEVGNHDAIPRPVNQQTFRDEAVKRLPPRRAAVIHPSSEVPY